MQLPAYWSRSDFTHAGPDGNSVTRSDAGWSFVDQAEADRVSASRAERAARAAWRETFGGQSLRDWKNDPDRLADAYYVNLPLREPVIESVDVNGVCVGLITRNRYGCRVLNAESVLFADIDLVPSWRRPGGRSLWQLLIDLFRGRTDAPASPAREAEAIDQITAWHIRHPGTAVRVYRTYAGLRLMLVHRRYEPTEAATLDVLRELQSDPLYVSLTKRQECFRARLSPKPWRVGVSTPPNPSLVDSPDDADRLATWTRPYESKAAAFGTCQLVHAFGDMADDAVITAIVAVHDRDALAGNRPLA